MTRSLIVGAGSIGSRHADVLTQLGNEVGIVSRRDDLPYVAFTDLDTALARFDPGYVVIANETYRHGATVDELASLDYRGTVLIEKPMNVSVQRVEAAGFDRVGVGYNLRFHPVVAALSTALGGRTALTLEVYVGQHLTSWRPGRPVQEQYSASRAHGGGVLRDLAHEFDYIAVLFGQCTGVFARGGRLADLTVDSDDSWGMVASFRRATVATIQLNYLDTMTRRRLLINTGDSTIEADFIASTLRIDDELVSYPTSRDSSYRAMHHAMLNEAGHRVATPREAAATDDLIGMIEKSAAQEKWIDGR